MLEETRHIKISDYDYPLPDERIAKFPLAQRDHSKLLLYKHGEVGEDVFCSLPTHLPKGALMVFNNTRVIQARMHFRKETGALIEIFLMEPAQPTDYELMFQTNARCSWLCMIGNLKKWKEGTLKRSFEINGNTLELTATVDRTKANAAAAGGTNHWVDFAWDNSKVSFAEILEAVGELPIPPYLNRNTQESDKQTYQTVYSKIKGSVAAPTAGLHFTDKVLAALDEAGIVRDELTLHVGAGTFKPVKSTEIEGHNMHTEYVVVHRHTLENLLSHGCSAIAVGTTSVRTLESLYYMGVKLERNPQAAEDELHVCQWEPYEQEHNADGLVVVNGTAVTVERALQNLLAYLDSNGLSALHSSTQIIIAPGFNYKIVKMLVTNFHQPQSTLLLLVSAFLKGDWHKVYDYALANNFRFLSYGDSSLLIP
ncbi:S-adenosylmethionine tRNA ribosyltransferase [Prevotella intermedia]|uniref:S-adenosylmethionine tRNA ribosyltransferase n=1 Tax=Prevotella intermedia TaxID=28131 RepID=A0AAJ3V8T6_PREIN|nr:S-adenosylmethionine:tRNA ribosyltransferase-isomerase [Prevotella intermedia]PIK17337.1 S-adenosylmethionine tRNA ribosyltransferase [Prevotella intermedia]